MSEKNMSGEDFIREELLMDERDQMIEGKAARTAKIVGEVLSMLFIVVFFFKKQNAFVWMLLTIVFLENASSDMIRYKHYKTKAKLISVILQIILAFIACVLMISYIMEP